MGLREEEVAVEVAACALSVVYGALACAALGKLVHIHYYSKAWTPQKLFHVLVCAVAAGECPGPVACPFLAAVNMSLTPVVRVVVCLAWRGAWRSTDGVLWDRGCAGPYLVVQGPGNAGLHARGRLHP